MSKLEYITASEIGDYVYCKRAWWLRFQGLSDTNLAMKEGSIQHTKLDRFLAIIRKLTFITAIIFTLAAMTLLISFFL